MARKNKESGEGKAKQKRPRESRRIPKDTVWALAEFYLDLAVSYERDPASATRDQLHGFLLKQLEEFEPKFAERYDRDYFERSAAKLVQGLAFVYGQVSKGHLSPEKTIEAVKFKLSLVRDLIPRLPESLDFLAPTAAQIREMGGAAELAKFNAGLLLNRSQRSMHAIRKRAEAAAGGESIRWYRYALMGNEAKIRVLEKLMGLTRTEATAIQELISTGGGWSQRKKRASAAINLRTAAAAGNDPIEFRKREDATGFQNSSAEKAILCILRDVFAMKSRSAAQFAELIAEYMREVFKWYEPNKTHYSVSEYLQDRVGAFPHRIPRNKLDADVERALRESNKEEHSYFRHQKGRRGD